MFLFYTARVLKSELLRTRKEKPQPPQQQVTAILQRNPPAHPEMKEDPIIEQSRQPTSTVINVTSGDIVMWLTSIGMKRHAEKFVKEEISIPVLEYLTEDHLEKLGVGTIGERLTILAAINKLKRGT